MLAKTREIIFAKHQVFGSKSAQKAGRAKGHAKLNLPQEAWDKLVAWIDLNCPYAGDYMEANAWKPEEQERYRKRIAERKRNEAIEAEAIKAFFESGQ